MTNTTIMENTNNTTTNLKEEMTMTNITIQSVTTILHNAATIIKKQDENYVTNESLRDLYHEITGKVLGKKTNRTQLMTAIENTLPEIPESKEVSAIIIPDDLAKKILALTFNKAAENKVKCFISDYMLTSIINKIMYDKYTVEYDPNTKETTKNTFTDEQMAEVNVIKHMMVSKFFVPHGKGYKIRAYYMAWRYGNTVLTYRFIYKDKAKGFVDYAIDVKAKTITNKKSGTVVALTKENCALLDIESVIFVDMK